MTETPAELMKLALTALIAEGSDLDDSWLSHLAEVALDAVLPAHERMVREQVVAEIMVQKTACPDHPMPFPKPSCWTCGRNGAFHRAARIARGPQDAPTAPAQPATPATGDTDTTGSAGGDTDDLTDAEEWAVATLTRRCTELAETAERYRQSWNDAAERAEKAETALRQLKRDVIDASEANHTLTKRTEAAERERDEYRLRCADYESAICFETTCIRCARDLDEFARLQAIIDRYRTAWWSARIRAAKLHAALDAANDGAIERALAGTVRVLPADLAELLAFITPGSGPIVTITDDALDRLFAALAATTPAQDGQ